MEEKIINPNNHCSCFITSKCICPWNQIQTPRLSEIEIGVMSRFKYLINNQLYK